MTKDYLALRTVEPEDAEQHGVKGMHWGVIRDTATKARDHLKRKAKGEEVTPTKKAAGIEKKAETSTNEPKQVVGAASGETSSARYARLSQQAKSGQASDMSELDLKFFNARTQALATINKMNEVEPGWLSKTSKKVLQQTAQNTMQSIADGVSKKYISDHVLDAINSKSVEASIAEGVLKKAREEAIAEGIKKATSN